MTDASFARACRRFAALLSVATACAAHAAPVQISFEANLTQDPFGISRIGAPVSGLYTFDPTAPDDIANQTQGSFTSIGPAFGFNVDVDGVSYATPGLLNIGTQAGNPGLYLVTGTAGGLTLELVLSDDTGSGVASDALPPGAPALANFGVREFRLFAPDAEFTAGLQGLQVNVPSVPEPAPVLLYLAGLAAVSARRRRPRSAD